jgi:hypothetical protein
MSELTFDEAEAAGFDGTGRDLDPRFPYHDSDVSRLDFLILTMPDREVVSLSLREGIDFIDEDWPEFGPFYILETGRRTTEARIG